MLINHYSMYQPFLLFTTDLLSLYHFDITVCTCTLSKCMLVSTTYCTSPMLLLYMSLTVCTMRLCVLSTCYFTAEPMLCGTSVSHQRKTCLITASDQLTCIATVFGHQSEINVIISACKKWSLMMITMNERVHICPICDKKVLQHSYFVLCKSCHRNVHRNRTQFSHAEFQFIETNTPWYCRLCNESIFAFNHIESDSEFVWTLRQFMNTSLYLDALDRHQDSEIFDPFELNDDDNDNIIEYQGERDPDKNYFNQLAHHLSKSSYHIEDSFNKYSIRNNVNMDDFSLLHNNIRSIPANLSILLSYMSNLDHEFSVIGLSETWLSPSNTDAYGIAGYNHVAVTRQAKKGGCLCSYQKNCCIPKSKSLML